MLPPYTNCLGDYFNSGANRVQVKAILRDISRYDKSLKFSLSVKVKVGNTVVLESVTPYPIELSNANVINDLREYVPLLFSPAADNKGVRASGNYATNGYCLPEGSYEFVFQVFDFYKKNVPLSEPFSMFCYLNQAEAPVAVYPEDGACGIGSAIGISEAGVQFQWMDPIAYGPSNKMYEFVLTEKGSGSNLVGNMFSDVSEDNSLNLPVFSDKVYNNTFRYVPATSGTFVKGKEYCWYVVAKGGNITGEKDDHYAFKNKGKSNVNCFIYGDCPEKEKIFDDSKVKKTDDKLKVVLEKVDVDNDKKNAEATWKSETGDFCKYYVYYYRKDLSDASAEKAEIKDLTSLSTVLNNLEPGYEYSCYVIGATNCDKEGEAEVLSPKSNELSFKLDQKKEDDKCDADLTAIVCENLLEELNKKDYFFGATSGEIVTVTEVTKNTDNSFTGKGIVSCSIFKNKLGLNVTFDNILINTDRYLCKGEVKVVHDDVDNLVINLNEAAGKKQGAEKAKQQESLGTQINDLAEAKNYPNQTVIFEGKLYAVDADGNAVEVGEYLEKDKVCEPKTGLDNEDGTVLFDVEKGLNGDKYDPYIDKSPNPFQAELVKKGYEWQTSSYPIPWLSMVEGEVRWITAELSGKKEAQSNLNIEDVDFYCYAADGSAVKLEKKIYGSKVKLKVYGGKKNTALKIYARKNAEKVDGECPTNEKTFGVVNVYSMSHQTKKILLAPVLNEMTLDNLQQMQDDVNIMFAPLGKSFEFTLGAAYTSDKDPELARILENGLNTNEGENHFTMETTEMRYIRKNYLNYVSNVNGYDACLFLIPTAQKAGLLGYMPLNKSVGYIVIGNSNKVTLDANTIAHELCHGLYDIQHVFDYKGVSEGCLPINIMDYPKSDANVTDRYLTKYYQWVNAENGQLLHLSFLDDTDDAEISESTIETGLEFITDKIENGWSFTEDDLSNILDVATEESPTTAKAVIKTYREVARALDCATSGQSVEYCLCQQSSRLISEAIEIVSSGVTEKIDDYCSGLSSLLIGDLCEKVKDVVSKSPEVTKEKLYEKFCTGQRRNVSNVYAKIVDEKDVPGGNCVKYQVEGLSGDKVTLGSIKFNNEVNIGVTNSLINTEEEDEFNAQAKSKQVPNNKAIRIKKGDQNWAKASWFLDEVLESFKTSKSGREYYGEYKSYCYTEAILVNVCCQDEPVTVPKFDLTFKFKDDNIVDDFTNEKGSQTISLQNYNCVTKKFEEVSKKCVPEIPERYRTQFNLPTEAKLRKVETEWYVDVNGVIDKQYIVTVDEDTDADVCNVTIKECQPPFDSNVKSKFNLPSNAKLIKKSGKYYVKFTTDCCDFEFRAVVNDCKVEDVILHVPNFTIVGNKVYFDNKLKNFNEVTWPALYINCNGIYINGNKQSFKDYFTIELMKDYFMEVCSHWMYYSSPSTFKQSLYDFCSSEDGNKMHSYTLQSEWENIKNNRFVFALSRTSAMNCYSTSIDWEQLHTSVLTDIETYAKGCEPVSFNCLLGKLISSMSKHMMEDFSCSGSFIFKSTINGVTRNYISYYIGDNPTEENLNATKLKLTDKSNRDHSSEFSNSLSETIFNIYVYSHLKGANDSSWTTIMFDADNHITAFSYHKNDLYSFPYWIVNFNCGCK